MRFMDRVALNEEDDRRCANGFCAHKLHTSWPKLFEERHTSSDSTLTHLVWRGRHLRCSDARIIRPEL